MQLMTRAGRWVGVGGIVAGLLLLPGCAGTAGSAVLPAAAAGEPMLLQWRPLPSPCSVSLRGLVAIDGGTAVVGGKGNLWRTDDGGFTWRNIAPPGTEDCDFRDLAAPAKQTLVAMVAGQPARLYRSVDGGVSWQVALADPRPAAFFDAIAFAGDFGVLFGDPIDGAAQVCTSVDAGASWQPLPASSLPVPLVGEAAFAASGGCVHVDGPVGDERIAIVTGGAERARLWLGGRRRALVAVDLPVAAGSASQGAFAVAGHGGGFVVVGGDYQRPKLSGGTAAASADGGRSWSAASAGGFRSAIQPLRDGTLLAVGAEGCSRSRDGGRTWQLLPSVGWHSLAIGADGSIWCCGDGGRVAKIDLLAGR